MNHQEPTSQNITLLFQEGNRMNAGELTTEANPLFETIHIDGRTYITSKKLHQDYRNNGGENYSETKSFMRMIRQIPLYQDLLAAGSMLEICQKKASTDPVPAIKLNNIEASKSTGSILEPLLKGNYGNPFMLIDPVAQKCIENHLENEASKEAALRTNALGAAVETGDEHAKQIAAKGYGKLSALNGGLQHLTEFLTEQAEKIIELEKKSVQLEIVKAEVKEGKEERQQLKENLADCFLSNSQLLEVESEIKRLARKESRAEGGIPYCPAKSIAKRHIKNNFIDESYRTQRTYKEVPQNRYEDVMLFLAVTNLSIFRKKYWENRRFEQLEKEQLENENKLL